MRPALVHALGFYHDFSFGVGLVGWVSVFSFAFLSFGSFSSTSLGLFRSQTKNRTCMKEHLPKAHQGKIFIQVHINYLLDEQKSSEVVCESVDVKGGRCRKIMAEKQKIKRSKKENSILINYALKLKREWLGEQHLHIKLMAMNFPNI